jgi:hypothetical protein
VFDFRLGVFRQRCFSHEDTMSTMAILPVVDRMRVRDELGQRAKGALSSFEDAERVPASETIVIIVSSREKQRCNDLSN